MKDIITGILTAAITIAGVVGLMSPDAVACWGRDPVDGEKCCRNYDCT